LPYCNLSRFQYRTAKSDIPRTVARKRRFWVYILTNKSKSVLYIGVSNNLARRLGEHQQAAGDKEKFTGRYYAGNLIYYEELPSAKEAIRREKQLKGFSKDKKIALILAFNPKVEFLEPPA
jgi:putative endonuclease